ncbi:MAG: TIGR00282 family metallophosphoesterase [Cytophagales bacterium]|nr:TIGR00282 family metallophosphoesterase [Armatimonadota bacterium]
MKILFLGDIVGRPGRDIVTSLLPALREEFQPDIVIANAENVAGGWGITPTLAQHLLSPGLIDVITMGNHTWAKESGVEVMENEARVLRPANYPPGAPGRGHGLFKTASGALVGVANLNGRIFMDPLDDPFRAATEIACQLHKQTPIVFFDFHAETTSEKAAFGWHCDGRASVVVGTHTHVQTADERVLPGGTAFITDVGMCGPVDSVIGMDTETVLTKFRTQLPHRFKVAEEGPAILCGVVIDVDETTGRAQSIERIRRSVG